MSKIHILSCVHRNGNCINSDKYCYYAEILPGIPETPPRTVFRPSAKSMDGNAAMGAACCGNE